MVMMKSTEMQAELVATGAELLDGRVLNTHAQRLGLVLDETGMALVRVTSVPDDRAVIASAVREAMERVPLVFVTGGIGPTCDDLTREALADALGRKIVRDAVSLASLQKRYAAGLAALTEACARQADILEGAEALSNSEGAAPGQRIETSPGRTIFVLPGPPREFEAVLSGQVIPWLRARYPEAQPSPRRIFMVCGLGESDVIERLDAAGFRAGSLRLAYCAAPGVLEVRLTGRAGDDDAVEAGGRVIRLALGDSVYSEEREDLASVAGRLLLARGARLTTAESCTGGYVGARITAIPGSSAWYVGGVVAYANKAKTATLGVEESLLARHGAVSGETARAMAEGIRVRMRADIALSVTGIAGPGGGTPEKPTGLVWWAVSDAHGVAAESRVLMGSREHVRQAAAQNALNLLRRRLLGLVKNN